jgi:2-polyprenyl-3-methyl-5-hydroxy-6-metoxy-1,4-benzoquinol methylase
MLKRGVSPYVKKDERWSSHQVIAEWLMALEPGLIGLDVGTATGTLGQMTGSHSPGIVLDGIEPQAEWAASAAPYYRNLYSMSVEEVPDQKLGGYDVLIFGDALEHLVDPQAVLARLSKLEPEHCIFIISVPNVANIWIRINLLLGRFEYQDRGILDRTHLRFFTWDSLKAMLLSAGLDIKDVRTTPIPLPQLHDFFAAKRTGRMAYGALYQLTLLFPRLLGYQFIVKAVKHRK